MAWYVDRLRWLKERITGQEISSNTGIPNSTLSYVIRGLRTLPSRYLKPTRLFYTRSAYRALRNVGLSVDLARRYRGLAPSSLDRILAQANDNLERLVNYRFDQYKQYLINQGRYESDSQVYEILRESIAKGLGRSRVGEGDYTGKDSPSLRYIQ